MADAGARQPEELLRQIRTGRADALGQLLELYRSYLALCARLQIKRDLQAKFSASDVVQDTFLQAQQAFPHFRGQTEAEFIQWLRRLLVTQLARRFRLYYAGQTHDVTLERQLEEALDDSSEAIESLALSQISPSQAAAHREQAVLLAQALERLPDDYREVIVARHFEGIRFREIGERLERSEEAVRKIWVRALDALRRALGDQDL